MSAGHSDIQEKYLILNLQQSKKNFVSFQMALLGFVNTDQNKIFYANYHPMYSE